MNRRHLLLASLCLLGFSAVAANLLPKQRLQPPDEKLLSQCDQSAIEQTIALLDDQFHADWKGQALTPAPVAPDLLVARRLSLALTGTIPSLEEIRAFESQAPQHRLNWWLDRLLTDRRYADYLAERLGRAWVGTEGGPFIVYRRRRFVSWLSDRIRDNLPYDELVRTILTGSGLWTDSPQVNFFTVTSDPEKDNQPDPQRLAARTTRAFLAVRLDCVQCHDDHLGGPWLQSDFHELAAFFGGARNSFVGIKDQAHPYRVTYLGKDAEETVAPAVPFAEDLLEKDETRRQELANWITASDNRPFARAIVNRIWGLMFGKPLVEPIDNIPLEGPYPTGMERLVDDFLEHHCDLQRLIRVIARSQAFQRDSCDSGQTLTVAHEQAWATFPIIRLRPEQAAGAILQAASLRTMDASSHILVRLARYEQQENFIRRYGDRGEEEFARQTGTIPQRLLMLNGDLVQERTKDDFVANAATRIASLARDDAHAVECAYLTILTRRPNDEESKYFCDQLALPGAPSREEQLEDICWTLLNGSEFSWGH